MRLLVANPDTLGDLVLRQPLFTALTEAGHELMLIVRPSVAALVPYVAPQAQALLLPHDVFAGDLEKHWGCFDELLRRARDWSPDMLVVASYQWTVFEEYLAEQLPGVRRAGMNGVLFGADTARGERPQAQLRFDLLTEVPRDLAEIGKNEALASTILGRQLSLPDPRIAASSDRLDAARDALTDRGLESGRYWTACVGGTSHVPIKIWPLEHWAQLLSQWGTQRDRRFLFVGLPSERHLAEKVQANMGEAASRTSLWMDPPADLEMLVAMLSLSSGYVGHDTGPMHLAAALGKPVMALFGGGHWPRFTPNVSPGIALTVAVPCVGCDWACGFEQAHCVSEVSVTDALRAVDDLENGRITGRETRVIPPSVEVLSLMVREGRDRVEAELRRTATVAVKENAEKQELYRAAADHVRMIDERGGEINALRAKLGEMEREQGIQVGMIDERGGEINALRAKLTDTDDRRMRFERLLHERETEIDAARQDPFNFLLSFTTERQPALTFRRETDPGLVSVIIPAYNAASFVEDAVESVWQQQGNGFRTEILLCDDGSSDRTWELAMQLRSRSPVPLEVLTHPERKNRGVSATRNLGLGAARGEFAALLDADDRWLPHKLKLQVEFMRAHPQTQVVCSLGYNRDAKGEPINGWNGNETAGDYRHVLPPNDFKPPYTFEQLLKGDPIVNSTLFIRRSAIEAVGGYPRLMAHQAEDWLLLAKLALAAPIELIDQPLIDYMVHEQSYTTQFIAHNFAFGARLEFLHHLVHWMVLNPVHRERGERIFRAEYPRMVAARASAYKLIEDFYRHHNGHTLDVHGFEAHLSGVYAELEQLRIYAGEREWMMKALNKVPGLRTAYGLLRKARQR